MLQHHKTLAQAPSAQTEQGVALLDSYVARVLHDDALRRLALLQHRSEVEVLLVQADVDALAGAPHHEEGARQPLALQHHFPSERLDAALWGENHLHFAGVSFGLQIQFAGGVQAENLRKEMGGNCFIWQPSCESRPLKVFSCDTSFWPWQAGLHLSRAILCKPQESCNSRSSKTGLPSLSSHI